MREYIQGTIFWKVFDNPNEHPKQYPSEWGTAVYSETPEKGGRIFFWNRWCYIAGWQSYFFASVNEWETDEKEPFVLMDIYGPTPSEISNKRFLIDWDNPFCHYKDYTCFINDLWDSGGPSLIPWKKTQIILPYDDGLDNWV